MFEDLPDYEYHIAAAQLILAMLGLGATFYLRDFVGVLRASRALVLGIAFSLLRPLAAAIPVGYLGPGWRGFVSKWSIRGSLFAILPCPPAPVATIRWPMVGQDPFSSLLWPWGRSWPCSFPLGSPVAEA